MTAAPRVSILMPVRNGERWLPEAIQSVLSQTFLDFELLIIDDGSSDSTHAIVTEFQRSDARVRLIQQKQLGLVAALNNGIAAAQGGLIARLDADDVALPNRLERQVAVLDAQPDLVLLGTWAEKIDELGRPIGMLKPESAPDRLKARLLKTNPFIHSSVVFSTKAARACGGYRKVFEAAEDFDLWLRLSEIGEIANLPYALIRYRIHQSSVSAKSSVRQLFSSRLAIRSALARRRGEEDFAAQISEAPDWNDITENSKLAADARVYRVLQYATDGGKRSPSLAEIRFACSAPLNHTERKIAQKALLMAMSERSRFSFASRAELAARFFLLHPGRAFKLLSGSRVADVDKNAVEK